MKKIKYPLWIATGMLAASLLLPVPLTWAQTTPVMQIPVGAVYLAMPIGFALMVLHLAVMARGFVRHRTVLGDGEFDADTARP